MYFKAGVLAALYGFATAELLPRQATITSATPTSAAAPSVTAISGCHLHGSALFCKAGTTEYSIHTTPTATTNLPAQFTGCHHHGNEMFCIAPDGEEVEVEAEGAEGEEHDHESESASGGRNCHFHAGVEHCVGGDGSESHSQEATCKAPNRDYNVGLRVGLLFVILATSAIGVFSPILLQKALPNKLALPFTILKQFGTGIIISTALVHLYTHASLMFGNECLGELEYESTTSAIVMAGLFLSFLVEYVGHRIVLAKTNSASSLTTKEKSKAMLSAEVVSILVMEAGILFHSLLIGLTLVVAGDSFFRTLFVVILFHQLFEGIALGTRIAAIGSRDPSLHLHEHACTDNAAADSALSNHSSEASAPQILGLPLKKQLALAALFAFITPIGMAIGIGVLQQFNGNDRSTLIAIGTLDALSAGILIWVGVVEMWAADWMVGAHGQKAELADADILTVVLAGLGLVAGLAVMSLLGKWA